MNYILVALAVFAIAFISIMARDEFIEWQENKEDELRQLIRCLAREQAIIEINCKQSRDTGWKIQSEMEIEKLAKSMSELMKKNYQARHMDFTNKSEGETE